MSFEIITTQEADTQLQNLPVREQRIVGSAILSRLCDQPARPTRSIKRLRPNRFAQFELRIGQLRVLQNVDEDNAEVILVAVGRQVGSILYVGDKEFHAHEANPPQ